MGDFESFDSRHLTVTALKAGNHAATFIPKASQPVQFLRKSCANKTAITGQSGRRIAQGLSPVYPEFARGLVFLKGHRKKGAGRFHKLRFRAGSCG
jgi:hypothetical protein